MLNYRTKSSSSKIGISVLLITSMSSCSTVQPAPPPVYPPAPVVVAPPRPAPMAPPPVVPERQGLAVEAETVQPVEGYRITRSFITEDGNFVPTDDLPNGVLLLKRDDPRNQDICKGFLENLPNEYIVKRDDPEAKTITTYWLMKYLSDSPANCDFMLSVYDFDRAEAIAERYYNNSLTSPSLLLVEKDGRYVSITFDDDASGADIGDAFSDWFGGVVDMQAPLNDAPASNSAPNKPRSIFKLTVIDKASDGTTTVAAGGDGNATVTVPQIKLPSEQAQGAACMLADKADKADEKLNADGTKKRRKWWQIGVGFLGDVAKVVMNCSQAV